MKININYELDTNKDIINQILEHRGLDVDWVNAGEKDLLDFSVARNYNKGKELLLKHINEKSNIGILMDSDADGITSYSIMKQWLLDKQPQLNISSIIPEGKVHGIFEQLIPNDIKLLIVPDASTSESKKHKIMADRGIDVLVLDHHEFLEEENSWSVIINPKNPLCPYENDSLSGAGVVWKFVRQIDLEQGSEDYKKYTDLAAIGIVGDVMSLKHKENKAIVNLGMSCIQNPYFKAYLKSNQRVKDKPLNPNLISFYMVPLVNSLIRVGGIEEKIELAQAMTGEIPAEPIIAGMVKIKGGQDRKKDSLVPRIVMGIQKANREKYKIIFAESPINLPKSMTGLVAGQLCGMYLKPTLMGREEDGFYVGSIRSINDSTIANFKDFCEESGLFEWVAGHQSACGFKIKKENLDKFLEYGENHLPPFEKIVECDFKIKGNKREVIIAATQFDDHVGCDIKPVLIYDEIDVTTKELEIIGKNQNVLKIQKDDVTYIKFDFKKELPSSPVTLKIVGKPNLNEWMGTTTPQIMIEEMEFAELEF